METAVGFERIIAARDGVMTWECKEDGEGQAEGSVRVQFSRATICCSETGKGKSTRLQDPEFKTNDLKRASVNSPAYNVSRR